MCSQRFRQQAGRVCVWGEGGVEWCHIDVDEEEEVLPVLHAHTRRVHVPLCARALKACALFLQESVR